MKQAKILVLTMVVTLCTFAAFTYSSCIKDGCKGASCQNGTNCSGGVCQCPAGYSGNFCELSAVLFKNDTYTPIYITVSGSSTIIPVDSTVSFTGASGSSYSVYAYTFGTAGANVPVGDTVSWSMGSAFPTGGITSIQPLDVNENYFYLEMKNTDSTQSVTTIHVNYMIAGAESVDNITIPNDGHVYGLGYYVTYPLTQIYATSASGNHWLWIPAIQDTTNAFVLVTAN